MALVLHSVDILFPPDGGVKGGANRVNLFLLQALIANPHIELTLITLAGTVKQVAGVDHYYFFEQSIHTHKTAVLAEISAFLEQNSQDSVLFSDIIAPFGSTLFHSHSFAHRQAIKGWWVKPFTAFATAKRHNVQLAAIGDVSNRTFFTVSNAVKQDWAKHFHMDLANVVVAYPGVVLPEALLNTTAVTQTESSHKVPVLGMINTSSFKKGGWIFILALGLLKAGGCLFTVNMVHPKIHKDPLTTGLIHLLGLKSVINILPFQADTSAFYAGLDVFVMPSLHEAFGLVVTEAMAHGVIPVVAANAGAAELIEPEQTGFTFAMNIGAVWQLYQVLRQVVTLPEHSRMQVKVAAQQAAKHIRWEKFTTTIIERL